MRPAGAWILFFAAAASADPAVQLEGEAPARIEAIGKFAERRAAEALPAIREAAAAGDRDVRLAAIDALGEFGREEDFARLHDFSQGGEPRVAAAAARALGRCGFKATPYLVDALRHEAAGVREAAESALQRASGIHAEGTLLAKAAISSKGDRFAFCAAILEGGASPRAAADAIRALPEAPGSASLLVKQLGAEFEPVRAAAVSRLEGLVCRRLDVAGWNDWLKSAGKGPLLAWREAAWRDAANPLCAAAARALAVPEKDAVEALAAREADGVAEEEALKALVAATGLRARTRAEWTAWWAANRDRSRVEWLLAALIEAGDAPNRAAAARSLGAERDPRAREHLQAYGVKDADPVVRCAAEESLRALAGPGPGLDKKK